jgi:hypothetical protein
MAMTPDVAKECEVGLREPTGSPNRHIYGATSTCLLLWSPSVTSRFSMLRTKAKKKEEAGRGERLYLAAAA